MTNESIRIQAALLGQPQPALLSIAGMAYCTLVAVAVVFLFAVVLK